MTTLKKAIIIFMMGAVVAPLSWASGPFPGRNASFFLIPGISLFGGFQGNEVLRSQREWNRNITILSGEIGDPSSMADNTLHVVTGADGAVIDGFNLYELHFFKQFL